MRANRGILWSAIATTVIGWAPATCVYWASAFAERHGCRLDEGDAHACVVGGHDYGPVLYDFFVMGWLMLLTFPVMIASIVLWVIVIVQWLRRPRAPIDTEGNRR